MRPQVVLGLKLFAILMAVLTMALTAFYSITITGHIIVLCSYFFNAALVLGVFTVASIFICGHWLILSIRSYKYQRYFQGAHRLDDEPTDEIELNGPHYRISTATLKRLQHVSDDASYIDSVTVRPQSRAQRLCSIVVRVIEALIITVTLVTMVVIAVAIAYLQINTLPTYSGSIAFPQLTEETRIEREESGMIHIIANNDHDLYFAQGVAMAQERLFQMDFMRRLVTGSLAEVAGEGAVDYDVTMRTYGLYISANNTVTELLKEESDKNIINAMNAIKSFCEGVNAYLDSNPPLPIEFMLLNYRPAPFSPVDVLSTVKLLSLDLSGNAGYETNRALLLASGINADRINTLYPIRSPNLSPTILKLDDLNINFTQLEQRRAEVDATILTSEQVATHIFKPKQQAQPSTSLINDDDHFLNEHLSMLSLVNTKISRREKLSSPSFFNWLTTSVHGWVSERALASHIHAYASSPFASNNWVVSPKFTSTGSPILCNDPHLSLNAPAIWILMHLQSPTVNVIGAAYPGAAGIIIGHNDEIGWGVTNGMVDVQDLYVMTETDDGRAYVHNDEEKEYVIRNERIKVKDGDEINHVVRETTYGPIIRKISDKPIALRWNALDPVDTTFVAIFAINQARNWGQFVDIMQAYFVCPTQNFIYADTQGNIGYMLPGRLPIRVSGHSGAYPMPGTGAFDWQGWIPQTELPMLFNPERGFIATANNAQLPPEAYPHILSLDYAASWRAARIEELLIEGRGNITVEYMQKMLGDSYSKIAEYMLPILNSLSLTDQAAIGVRDRMVQWNRQLDHSEEGSVFEMWLKLLGRIGFSSPIYLTDMLTKALNDNFQDPYCFRNVTLPNVNYNEATPTDNICLAFAARAFVSAVNTLKAENHGRLPVWAEDPIHIASIPHIALEGTPLACLAGRQHIVGGGTSTVNVAPSKLVKDNQFITSFGPSYRQILDFSDLENSKFIFSLGQSGNLLSLFYANLLEDWAANRYLDMRTKAYAAATTLQLNPHD